MHPSLPQGQIRPKISSMPRQKSEASTYLDIYKLVVEKKRLQQELYKMDQRRTQILRRLSTLEQQVADLEGTVQQLREVPAPTATQPTPGQHPPAKVPPAVIKQPESFETILLEY